MLLANPQPDNFKDTNQSEETGFVRFIKVFLIAIALILFGILIGVISSKFLSGSMGDNSSDKTQSTNQAITSIITLAPSGYLSQGTSSSSSDIKNETFIYRNNSAGPLSFDLIFSGLWQESSSSASKTNLNLTLTRDNLLFNLFYNSKDSKTKPELCLASEDVAPKNLPYFKYKTSTDVSVSGLNWRLAKDMMSTESASYKVCEQNTENQYTSLTSFGYINIETIDGQDINKSEETQVLQLLTGFEKKEASTSSAIKR